jgi:hypothetical protein
VGNISVSERSGLFKEQHPQAYPTFPDYLGFTFFAFADGLAGGMRMRFPDESGYGLESFTERFVVRFF